MDKEEVVKELKRALRLAWDEKEQHCNIMDSDDALDVRDAIVDALDLLKATSTTPLEPIADNVNDVLFWYCAKCGSYISPPHHFCSNCGREVLWS